MSRTPTVLLVHGAFAESASWNAVITGLHDRGVTALAVANPLRSLTGDAAYLRDVVAGVDGPVLLVGHSYGGLVVTEAGADNPSVVGLVYVAAFAPDHGESALQLSSSFPGSTLGAALDAHPLSTGGTDLTIRTEAFHPQFAADVPHAVAALMARTQRPVTEQALGEGLPTTSPAWRSLPSWFVIAGQDRNIPPAAQRSEAERAGARGVRELPDASHAVAVSCPDEVVATILDAVHACAAVPAA